MNTSTFNPIDEIRSARALVAAQKFTQAQVKLRGVVNGLPTCGLSPATAQRVRTAATAALRSAFVWHAADYNRFVNRFGAFVDRDGYDEMTMNERIDLLIVWLGA